MFDTFVSVYFGTYFVQHVLIVAKHMFYFFSFCTVLFYIMHYDLRYIIQFNYEKLKVHKFTGSERFTKV